MDMVEDCLTPLPEELLHRILSVLPMDSAIRMGVLSKRWLHLWKFKTLIYFPPLPHTKKGFKFVDRCINLLQAPKITKFIVAGHFGLPNESSIWGWIDFVIARRVPILELYMMVDDPNIVYGYGSEGDRDECFGLQHSFYRHADEYMEHIALSCVDFNPPPPTFGFLGLKKLFLYDCLLQDENFKSTISACHVLESLTVMHCSGLGVNPVITSMSLKELIFVRRRESWPIRIEIDAPNLVIIKGYDMVMWISRFNKSCHPQEVRLINPPTIWDYQHFGNPGLLMDQLSCIQRFGINCQLFPLITKHVNEHPHSMFNNLEEFCYSCDCDPQDEMTTLLNFLGLCPSLTKLQIEFDERDSLNDNGELKMLPSSEDNMILFSPDRLSKSNDLTNEGEDPLHKVGYLHQIKTIEFFYYQGSKGMLALARCLLQKSMNLENLVLCFHDPDHHVLKERTMIISSDLKVSLQEQVSTLPRASPHVKIYLG